jgi:hypothetical protein
MVCAARSYGLSTPLWLCAAVLGFALWWPVGLAILLSFLWSRKMGCGHHMWRWRERAEEMHDMARRWRDERGNGDHREGGRREREYRGRTGNRVFDDYRESTLRRLEEDHREFVEFLDRLRRAKDQAEFEQFMAERTRRPSGPEQPAPEQPA